MELAIDYISKSGASQRAKWACTRPHQNHLHVLRLGLLVKPTIADCDGEVGQMAMKDTKVAECWIKLYSTAQIRLWFR